VRAFLEMAAASDRVEGTAIQTVGSKGYDGFALLVVTRLGRRNENPPGGCRRRANHPPTHRDLALYERALEMARATPEQLRESFFSAAPNVFCDLVESDQREVAGFAVWFLNYSRGPEHTASSSRIFM